MIKILIGFVCAIIFVAILFITFIAGAVFGETCKEHDIFETLEGRKQKLSVKEGDVEYIITKNVFYKKVS